MKKSALAVVVASVLLSGCVTNGLGQKELGGGLLGGAGGGFLGSKIGSGRGQLAATAIGTLLGVVVGAGVGQSLDNADYAANRMRPDPMGPRSQLLEGSDYATIHMKRNQIMQLPMGFPHQPESWANPYTNVYGNMAIIKEGYERGQPCRVLYDSVNLGGGRAMTSWDKVCQQPNGIWITVDRAGGMTDR